MLLHSRIAVCNPPMALTSDLMQVRSEFVDGFCSRKSAFVFRFVTERLIAGLPDPLDYNFPAFINH
jgi:hypothetical protein